MKKLIYFNLKDKPENMGQAQLTDNIETFIADNAKYIPNAKVVGNILTFDNGYAVVVETPNDFEN